MGNAAVLVIVGLLVATTVVASLLFYLRSRALEATTAQLESAEERLRALHSVQERYQPIMDLEAAIADLHGQREASAQALEQLRAASAAEQESLGARIEVLRRELSELEEEEYFASFGLYEPKYDFETAQRYRDQLDELRQQQKAMLKADKAATCPTEWTVSGSAAEGRKMVKNKIKLVLRAFNGECDAAIAKVRYNNIAALEKRIIKSRDAINKMAASTHVEITDAYLALKLNELHLFHEYQEKKQAEKEEQRRIKEQMREEKRAQEELERARRQAEDEERRYQKALDKARSEVERATGDKHEALMQEIEELQARLSAAHDNTERAISRAQLTRSGHVYVISNIGSFGEDVYKIGMTRRLEPMDRVKELGDASVPFAFDVHAMIYADDAPTLETELHRRFDGRRVNRINNRKEFFRVSLHEIEAAVHELHGEIEFTKLAEAEEYRKSLAMQRTNKQPLADPALARTAMAEPA